jgi:DNA invertase Pin-like site-specific DNA recombinase
MKPAIAYIRVSQQGKSGLGLEAQQALIQRFADQEGIQIVQTFTEVQTGKDDDEKRPQLHAALEAARKAKAPVIVAKLNRLSRDVHFISGLHRSRSRCRYRSLHAPHLRRPGREGAQDDLGADQAGAGIG